MSTKTNLLLELSSLVGRDSELSDIRRLIREQRLVTLSGPGGTGKTRIARKVARSLIESFEHGVWFIDLTGVFRDSGVAGAVARVLGFLEEEQIALSETTARQLASREILLVLDNCEQVLGGCAELAEKILTEAPQARVLGTSREPLHISGEFCTPRSSAHCTGWRGSFRGARSAGYLGLRERCVHERQDTRDRGPARCSAPRHRARRGPNVNDGPRPDTCRARQTLRSSDWRCAERNSPPQVTPASVAWSYDLMGPSEQGLARRLCVLRGFTLDTATAIGGVAASKDSTTLDLFQRLVDMSLVQVDRSGKETRYRFLETVRAFLLERLDEAGETDSTRSTHLSHFIDFAEAKALLDDAEAMAAALTNPFIDGLIRYQRGRSALARGDAGEAEVHLHEALEIQRDAGCCPVCFE